MAYNDDSVLARLSSLNESHDSIATAAQWIMFHRRHADQVAQQSKIRHKDDFIIAFSPVIAEAISIAYKGAPAELQGKLKRVVDVWKDRAIFEAPIQAAVEARIDELDRARGTVKPSFGASPFGGGSAPIPAEFAPLVSAHQNVTKLSIPLKTTITSANQEYEKQTDASTPVPSAPVYAARLNGLLKTLANAESAVAECVKAREGLISGLEKLLDANRAALEQDKSAAALLTSRKTEIEEKKHQVEVGIMRALGPADSNGSPGEGDSSGTPPEPDRPEMEALTPPAMESLDSPTPVTSGPEEDLAAAAGEGAPSYQSLPISTNGSNKRRRVDDTDDFPDLGGDDGIDADVAEMLKEGPKS
ncbi:hypothetical protein FALBO_11175 [Fusarium albosuccineum]|uniref:CID domain-containing protein n=1 Tax=Fusarium albosuccineum TaxID=1237068 RepID=A0A8H4L6A3_9HYPO|nr:hypothetical protein FALBO_11175 [Fusarium albosuccineum]